MADGTPIEPALPHPDRHTREYLDALRTRIDQIITPLPESRAPQLDAALKRLFLGVERGYVIANSHTREAIADRIATNDISEATRMLGHIRPSNSTPASALQEAAGLCREVARDFSLNEPSILR